MNITHTLNPQAIQSPPENRHFPRRFYSRYKPRESDDVHLSVHAQGLLSPFPNYGEQLDRTRRQVETSFATVGPGDRHEVNRALQTVPSDPTRENIGEVSYDGSPVVVIAFDGTAAFNPRRTQVMQNLGRELQEEGFYTHRDEFKPAHLAEKVLNEEGGQEVRWSALAHGPLNSVVKDPELNQNIQWLSFPSEEFEVLGDAEAWRETSPSRLVKDARRSLEGRPRGVEAAHEAIREIAEQAHEQGKTPKFVLLSHSSGGRSAVKFAEGLKDSVDPSTGKPIKIDLAVTIDPVREAHEAVGEAAADLSRQGLQQSANRAAEFLGLETRPIEPAAVRSRSQPESLYATSNVGEWVNFYQDKDTDGMKVGPRFGLRGSPIAGAENHKIEDVGSSGHGEIAFHDSVLRRVTDELRERVRP